MRLRFFATVSFVAVCWVAQAQAHGDVAVVQGHCLMKIGPDTMRFTGYQPLSSREEFCEDIPGAGPTIITLDAQQDELREMSFEMRVLRDVGQNDDNDNLEANTEYFSPPKKYKTGTLTFDHNFVKEGRYIGIVNAISDDHLKQYVARLNFVVGDPAGSMSDQEVKKILKQAISSYEQRDYQAAMKYGKQLTNEGVPYAFFLVGSMYMQGQGVEQDAVEAAKYLEVADKNGLYEATNSLGIMYAAGGSGIKKNDHKATEYFMRASQLDPSGVSEMNMGKVFAVRGDRKSACFWLNASKKKGYVGASVDIKRLKCP